MFGRPPKAKKVKSTYSKEADGTMLVSIQFTPFTHGHDLGDERNYDPIQYRKMVENPRTQKRIANGYAVGFYSHHSRQKGAGYVAGERDAEGNTVFPCCKTLSMEWVDGEVKHEQRILSNKIGLEVQTLIENAVGGFSSLHDLENGDFLGFDYVVSPNFSTNRVLVDNLCEDGLCSIDMDTITRKTENIVRDNIKGYLSSIGKNNKAVENAIYALEIQEDNSQKLLDSIAKAKEITDNEKEVLELEKKELSLELEQAKDYITDSEKELEELTINYKNELNSLRDTHEKQLDAITQQLKQEGFTSKISTDGIDVNIQKKTATIFKTVDFAKEEQLAKDNIKNIDIKKEEEKKPLARYRSNMIVHI